MGKIARWRGPQPKAAARIAFPRESLRAVRRPREAGSRLRQAVDHPHCLSGSQRGVRAKPCQGAQSCGRARIRTNERISGVCSGFVRKPGLRLFLGLLLSFRSAADSWDYRTSTLGAAGLSQQWYIRSICRDDHATKGWARTCPNGRVPKWENAKGDRANAATYLLPCFGGFRRGTAGFYEPQPLPKPRQGLISLHGYTTATPGTVRCLGRHGQAAELQEQLPQSRPIVQIHLDKFKGHGLRPSSPHNRLGLDGTHAVRKPQGQERARRQVAISRTYAAS